MSDIDIECICRKSDLGDWYIIERAEHDGRTWWEPTGSHSASLRCSARISDADVEGYGSEMLSIVRAIETGGSYSATRCAVDVVGDRVELYSPRNSRENGIISLAAANRLAAHIRATVDAE